MWDGYPALVPASLPRKKDPFSRKVKEIRISQKSKEAKEKFLLRCSLLPADPFLLSVWLMFLVPWYVTLAGL